MMRRGGVQSCKNREGWTVVELIVGLTLGLIVLTGVYQLVISQSRLYGVQREVMDTRQSLRSTAALFSSQLWGASGGDLYAIGPNSLAIRSLLGTSVVCSEHATESRLGLGATSGVFEATADDSALVFATDIDSWLVVSIELIHPDAASAGLQWCDWWGGGSSIEPATVLDVALAGGTPPDDASGTIMLSAQGPVSAGATVTFVASHPALTCAEFDSRAFRTIDYPPVTSGGMGSCTFTVTIPNNPPSADFKIKIEIKKEDYPQLSEDITFDGVWYGSTLDLGGGPGGNVTDYVKVGAPFRAFRRVEYSLFTPNEGAEDERWWLGQRVGADSTYEILTGPLLPPGDDGLLFTYYDITGAETDVPADVDRVQILMIAESFGSVPGAGSQTLEDSLTTMVYLRGNAGVRQ